MRNIALTFAIILSVLITGCDGRGDSSQSQPVINATVEPDNFLTFINNPPEIDSVAYAEKYYQTIDPDDKRTTLANWKIEAQFNPATAVHATFRDTKDLGYGRDMYAWQDSGNTYIYVDNYVVELEPGDATSYGPLNLDAAIAQDRKFQIGTNAIEFSPDPTNPVCKNVPPGPTCYKITKFFTFAPPDSSGNQPRITSADLDGRGVKHMPTMCVVCHGGTMYPLQKDNSFNPISLKSPQLHILEQDTLGFSKMAGFTEADQEEYIKDINKMVYDTYQIAGERADNNDHIGCLAANDPSANCINHDDRVNWDSDFAERLIELAYGDLFPGDDRLDQITGYTTNNVPAGWTQTVDRPNGVETLYRQVIAPHCIGCHATRGTQVAKSNNTCEPAEKCANAVNLSSYEEFIRYNDLIIDYVYRRGDMPRSLINFSQFWENPDVAPTLLATYLDGFDVFDDNGKISIPGRAVAIPGADRTVTSPAILDATASMYTASYSWKIVPPIPPGAVLNDMTSPRPELTAMHGTIVDLELTTSNANGNSKPVQVTITINDFLSPEPSELTFIDHIMGPNGVLALAGCISCHTKTNAPPGIPVYYNENDYMLLGREKDLYQNVLDRVDLDDPENSLLLRKPTSLQHGGGPVLDSVNYNTILNWIRSGAPCGNDTTSPYC